MFKYYLTSVIFYAKIKSYFKGFDGTNVLCFIQRVVLLLKCAI